jgi:SpoVK/Ycf46/Vps4 family AAA+-type ATPase
MAEPYANNLSHLYDELFWLDLNVRLAILRARSLRRDEGGMYVSDQAVEGLLQDRATTAEIAADEAELIRRIDDKREEITARVATSLDQGVALRLPQVAALFSLSPFEMDVFVICLGLELDVKYERLYAYLQDDATRRTLSVDLILNLLCRTQEERASARSVFLSSSRLFRYSLIHCIDSSGGARPFLSRSVKLDEGIAHHVLGGKGVDPRIASCCRLIAPVNASSGSSDDLPLLKPFQRYLAESPAEQWIALFSGQDLARQEETARRLCAESGVSLLKVDLEAFTEGAMPLSQVIPLIFRDAALKSAAVYVDNIDAIVREADKNVGRLHVLEKAMEELGWVTFLAGRQAVELSDSLKRQMLFAVDFPLPAYPERTRIWHEYAGNGTPAQDTPAYADLAARFHFTSREIRNALALARTKAMLRNGGDPQVTQADLEAACRAESNSRLIGFARKVQSTYSWDDLVLPPAHKQQLQEIIDHIRNHEAVYTEWGFSRKHSLGKGVNMLFSGPSGTGKTMAAGIISSELGLDCYKIDLSTVVSKYIGETEKNLNRIFAEAETSNAVLFFDEADALFGKRTEVKDSHDRYANIEVNYLLQKMEEHEGVVILATNLSKNMDEAFLRRVNFSVVFPFPEKEERLLVWNRVFPAEAPVGEDIDREFLARKFKITGGHIKNIAVGAAFLAKRDDSGITMRHVVLSAKREFQKIGKLTTKAEFGDYYDITA